MKQIMQHQKQGLAAIILLVIMATLLGCSKSKDKYSFKDSKEAVTACHSKLSELEKKKDASIEDIVNIVNDCISLRDSCYATFLRDTTFNSRGELAVDFVGVSDSISMAVSDLANSRPRSLRQFVDLKVGTAADREKIRSSKEYVEIEQFYEGLDRQKIFPDAQTTVRQYVDLMKKRIPVDDKGMKDFLAKEDLCFRSLLKFMPEIPKDIIHHITESTMEQFDSLEQSLPVGRKADEVMDKTMILMTMRINRRVIQNALSCRDQVKSQTKLDEYKMYSYRWMLMQPFMNIDQHGMACMTNDQIADMKSLAEDLPDLLYELDSASGGKRSKKEQEDMKRRLCSFFIKIYLNVIL